MSQTTRTTLYEKVFIDGFHKPSYVVATMLLAAPPDEDALRDAVMRTLERHPRLRSLVRTRFGVPVALVPCPTSEWLARGGFRVLPHADLHALEETALSTALDLERSLPLVVHVVRDRPAIVAKVHHAVIDGASGYGLFADFARALAGISEAPPRRRRAAPHRWERALAWASRVQLGARLPPPSIVTAYQPERPLDEEPVVYHEHVLRARWRRLRERAQKHGGTVSELVASSVLSAMRDYNAARGAPAPEIGLMVARARPRAARADSFSADTCVVSVPAARLARAHDAATFDVLRRSTRDPRHNDVALAAFYALRKWKGKRRAPEAQSSMIFTLSDVTAFGRGLGAGGALGVTDLRVLASPTSFDHGGMIVSRFGDDVRLCVVAHRGALDGGALLTATLTHLGES